MYFNTLYQSSIPAPAYVEAFDAQGAFDASTAPLLEATGTFSRLAALGFLADCLADDDTPPNAYSLPDDYAIPTTPYPDFASEVVSQGA